MPENEFRYSDIEFRQTDDGLGVVVGTVIRYGDRAKIGKFLTEEFRPGSLTTALKSPNIFVNRMHQKDQILGRIGGLLTLEDSEEALQMRLQLPPTALGRDTAYELQTGVLTGVSIEFGPVQQRFEGGTHRLIDEAILHPLGGMSLVSVPAYKDSIATMKRWDGSPKPVTRPRFFMGW